MTPTRFRLSRLTAFGLILSQALGLGTWSFDALAQSPSAAPRPALPTPMSASTLIGLEQPPQIAPPPNKTALPDSATPSYLGNNNSGNSNAQYNDLIQLYQDAAFSDPVLNAARFNYQASKELFWQGLSLLLPQANATPSGTRYYQHGAGSTVVSTGAGNSRVFDQKSYTVTLTQPVFNVAALEAFKQGDLNTKIADMNFFQAQQDLILRVSQAYFDALTSQDNVALYRNKKDLIKQQLDVAQAKFDAGLATIVDVNTAQASFDLTVSQEIAAQADLVVKKGVLEQLVGHPVGALKPLVKAAKIDGVLKDPRSKSKENKSATLVDNVNPVLPPGQTLDDWINQTEAANFKVLASQLSVSLAESTYRAAQALNYPSLNLVGTSGYNTSNGTPNSYTPAQTNVYNNTIALQMSIPLVSGGFNSSVIRQNAALVDTAKANYDNARRTAAQNTRAAFTGFYGGLASVKAYEAAERSSESAVESSRLGFQVGTLINIDVLIAVDTLFTTRSLLQQARYSTVLNALKLKASASSLSDEDLLAINSLLR
ncbi:MULTISPECIES: TolC family protein [unclassified Polynucleobacter]|jgi:outer membrane protein|uniref:TolC family protein n=1 Tax=unclassified Polynucleobacter TaxID=2640945 RepID=UPI00092ACB42|nr:MULTISPECIES: TolC family protein [unclassified Polynucleobacter]MBU3563553.1 TolC family protein [Polynucleobacter sp. Tro8-14-1]MEA9604705.1 TolC family protein [Polynucleobacter sp. JS-JIR-II-c23]OJI04733.1 type I secretion protein TolC [Polynucleobacter sp. MWH-Adler-W8]